MSQMKYVVCVMLCIYLCGCCSLSKKSVKQDVEEKKAMGSLKDVLSAMRHERNEQKAIDIVRKDPSLATQIWDGEDDVLIKGSTALHYAVHYDYVELAQLLLEHGADVNADKAHWWDRPLSWAADAARVKAVELLIANGVEINAGGGGYTALHVAAQGGSSEGKENSEAYRETAELLIKHGAEVNAKTETGITPLAAAIESGNKAIEEILRSA